MVVYPDASETGLNGPIPRDARLIAVILASMGVSDVEPAVLLQLLEFAHRYTYDVLSDALVYSDHANSRQAGTNLSLEDVNLAIQTRVNHSFTQPPEKDMLLSLASTVNAIPLPPISDRHGVRLPPQQHCLTNVNFSIVPNPPPEDFDDFEEQPQASASIATVATHADAGGEAAESQTTTNPGTQASSVFDTTRRPARGNDDEDEDYDNDDGDVSMTTVQPSQSQSQPASTSNPKAVQESEEHRGVKRSLDEDEDYD